VQLQVLRGSLVVKFFYLIVSIQSDLFEQLLNVRAIFSTHLVESHTERICQFFTLLECDVSRFSEIAFVSCEEYGNFRTGVFVDLLEPVLDISKRPSLIDRIRENNDKGSFVKSVG